MVPFDAVDVVVAVENPVCEEMGVREKSSPNAANAAKAANAKAVFVAIGCVCGC